MNSWFTLCLVVVEQQQQPPPFFFFLLHLNAIYYDVRHERITVDLASAVSLLKWISSPRSVVRLLQKQP